MLRVIEGVTAMPKVASALHFVVRADGAGHWLAIEEHGLAGGMFASREAAIDYCAFESCGGPVRVEEETPAAMEIARR
jgi:hypothetical protein